MTLTSVEETLALSRQYIDTLVQELSPLASSSESVDLVMRALSTDFDEKFQKQPQKLLEQLAQLEKTLDVELLSGVKS